MQDLDGYGPVLRAAPQSAVRAGELTRKTILGGLKLLAESAHLRVRAADRASPEPGADRPAWLTLGPERVRDCPTRSSIRRPDESRTIAGLRPLPARLHACPLPCVPRGSEH